MTEPKQNAAQPPDDRFLEQAFMEYYSWLCAASWDIVEDEQMAKDIVHDFFLYCYTRKPKLEKIEYFKKYAFTAVRNASINYKKRSRIVAFEDPSVMGLLLQADDSQQSAAIDKEKKEMALWEVIGSLPAQRRHIFLLSNRDGLKYAEIAGQLNISINTVKTQIRLAYQFLRKECGWMITTANLIISIPYLYGAF